MLCGITFTVCDEDSKTCAIRLLNYCMKNHTTIAHKGIYDSLLSSEFRQQKLIRKMVTKFTFAELRKKLVDTMGEACVKHKMSKLDMAVLIMEGEDVEYNPNILRDIFVVDIPLKVMEEGISYLGPTDKIKVTQNVTMGKTNDLKSYVKVQMAPKETSLIYGLV